MPRSDLARPRYYHGSEQSRGCSRCGVVGSILLFVLGLPLVIYNAPACFFGTSFEDEYYRERQNRLVAHNESTKAWKREGRRRCSDHLFADSSGAMSLFVRIRVADTTETASPLVRMHALTPLPVGDMIPDVFTELTEERLELPAPLRIVNTEPFDLSALEVRRALLPPRRAPACSSPRSPAKVLGALAG